MKAKVERENMELKTSFLFKNPQRLYVNPPYFTEDDIVRPCKQLQET